MSLVNVAVASAFHAVIGRIADGHDASIALHQFTLVGLDREIGRKFGRSVDVVVMQRLL